MLSRQASRSFAFLDGASMSQSRMLRAAVLSLALLCLSAVLIACGSEFAPTPVVVEVEKIVEVEKPVIVEKQVIVEVEKPLADPKTLTVYSGRSKSLVDPILREFELLTGVPIEIRYASTGEMAATLLEEGDKSPCRRVLCAGPGRSRSRETAVHDAFGRHLRAVRRLGK